LILLAFVSSLSFIANLATPEIPSMLAVFPEARVGAAESILSKWRPPITKGCDSQSRYHPLHPLV